MARGDTLTPKQAKFIALVADGLSYSEAYRGSYDAKNMSVAATQVEASRLANKEKVANAIEALRAEDRHTQILVERVTRSWVTQKLQEEATGEDNPPATRVRALELLGKTFGMFKDRLVTEDAPRTSEEIETEISALLERLFEPSGTPKV